MGTVSLDRPAQHNLGLRLRPTHGPGLISAQPRPPAPLWAALRSCCRTQQLMLLSSACLCFTPWLDFGPIVPLASPQRSLTNTPGSEIKLRRGIFSLDLAARHPRAAACLYRDAPGKESGRADPGSRGMRSGSAGAGRASLPGEQLPPSPACQGVSPSLSSLSSITQFNAGCCMPHP